MGIEDPHIALTLNVGFAHSLTSPRYYLRHTSDVTGCGKPRHYKWVESGVGGTKSSGVRCECPRVYRHI